MTSCYYCEEYFSLNHYKTKDHIIPKSKGGNNLILNTVAACTSCNGLKSDRLPEEFSAYLEECISGVRQAAKQGFNKAKLELVLKNNKLLIAKIAPYRIDLVWAIEKKKIGDLLRENIQKQKIEKLAKDILSPEVSFSETLPPLPVKAKSDRYVQIVYEKKKVYVICIGKTNKVIHHKIDAGVNVYYNDTQERYFIPNGSGGFITYHLTIHAAIDYNGVIPNGLNKVDGLHQSLYQEPTENFHYEDKVA